MKRNFNQHKLGLMILVSSVIFVMTLITLAFSGATLWVLINTDFILGMESHPPEPGKMIVFMLITSMIFGAIVAFSLSHIPLRPVNNLITQINRLASGDFKARLNFRMPIKHHPAFEALSGSFNKMAEELDSTEMLRSDFINNFSHEFKTPIVSIAGFAKLLKKGNLTEEQQNEYLDVIEKESMRLSNMATNVLNMTRVENLSILTDVKRFNLSEQMRSCILLFEDKWESKKIDFEVDFDEHYITANEELLKQVWINLIDNALKFSPTGGKVKFKIYEHEEQIAIVIGNTGPTISKEAQKKIFNKFYQSDESHSTEGNGIGLAIVKRVIDLHDGNISVRSEDDFTTFLVELPKSR